MAIRGKFLKCLAPAGYAWALALAVAGPTVFVLSGRAEHAVARLPFMRNHPVYSGGEIVRTEKTEGVEWRIHRPVFDGLISERRHGFVQIDVIGAASGERHTVDYDNDGSPDFILVLPSSSEGYPDVTTISTSTTGLENRARTREGWIVRVGLDRKAKKETSADSRP
jgi:hypothetical protein